MQRWLPVISRSIAGCWVMSAPSDRDLERLARSLGERLKARRWRVATAESCTGGWVAKAITDVPGSSRWFTWGVVTYANEAKTAALGVPAATIERHGAVSEPVVRSMALAARRLSGAELAVAISGVAGPGGGTAQKPVGTVWFAWSGPGGTSTERCVFQGNREDVRRQAVAHALEGLLARTFPDDERV